MPKRMRCNVLPNSGFTRVFTNHLPNCLACQGTALLRVAATCPLSETADRYCFGYPELARGILRCQPGRPMEAHKKFVSFNSQPRHFFAVVFDRLFGLTTQRNDSFLSSLARAL